MSRSFHRWIVVAAAASLGTVAACSKDSTSPTTSLGTTPGWFNGQTVTFDYTQQYACTTPPSSGATSSCELGAASQTQPAGNSTDTLWVLVPLGFTPPSNTLHCPTSSCVTHPTTIDLSRVFGAGTEQAATPPHSHIIRDMSSSTEGWPIAVVGVKDETTWDQLVSGKSITTMRTLQAGDAGGTHITGDIPTNLFLFFRTR